MNTVPKVHISRTCGHQGLRTHRTLSDAFGPYARLAVQERAKKVDRIIGVMSAVVICVGLVWASIS